MRNRKEHGKMKSPKGVFGKYLCSYVCVMLVPLILNSVLSYAMLYSHLTSNEIENQRDAIAYTEDLLSQQISGLTSIASEMSMEGCFVTEQQMSMSLYYDRTEYLMSNKAKNKFVYDILYADLSARCIYTGSSLYKEQDFEDNLYRYSKTDLLSAIEQADLRQLAVLPVDSASQYGKTLEILTIFVPIQAVPRREDMPAGGCAVFIIERNTLDTLVKAAVQGENSIGVLYYNGLPVYSSQAGSEEKLPAGEELPDAVELDGRTYRVLRGASVQQQEGHVLSLVGLVPEDDLNAVFGIIFQSLAIVGLLTMGVCSLLIVYFMRLNYWPLQSLFPFVHSQQYAFPRRMDEVQAVRYVLSDLSQKQEELLQHNRLLQKRCCFYTLLDSGKPIDGRFQTQCMLAGMALDGPCYQVIILCGQEEVSFFLRESFRPSCQAYWDDKVAPGEIVMVLSGTEQQLCESTAPIALWEVEKGIGSAHDGVSGLRDSCREAQAQLQRGAAGVPTLPLAEIRSAQLSLAEGDTARFLALSRGIADKVRHSSKEAAAMLYGVFAGLLLEQLRSQEEPVLPVLPLEKKYCLPPSSAEGAARSLLQLSEELGRALRGKGSKEQLTLQAVLDYIGRNCFDPSFSIKLMADYSGVSPSNLSHFFKNKTGLSLSQHIQSIKMTKAKELMLSTSLPLAEIINLLGYSDSSSFIRRFKAETGMTPGEFRAAGKPPSA